MPARSYERLEDWASHQKTIGDDTARWEEQDAARRKRNAELMAEKNANVSASDGPVTINPDNYKVGSEGDRINLARKEDEAQRRAGVQIDRRLSDTALADAYASRARQQEAIAMQGAAAMGLTPSAASLQTRAALDAQTQAAARAAAMGGGARAIEASAPGYGQQLAAGSVGRQAETQAAYRGAGQGLYGVRGADIGTFRQSQDAAYAQGSLQAAQAARNDALARAYAGTRTDLSLEQLAADQAYEAQAAANKLGVSDQQEKDRRLEAERDWRLAGTLLSVAGVGTSMAGRA